MVTVLRPLSTSELLDRTFHLYRNHFVVFVAILAIPQLAVLALQLIFAATILSSAPQPLGLLSLPIGLFSFLCLEISHAATVFAVSNFHLDRPVRIGDAFSATRGMILRVVGIALVVELIVSFGFVALLVPGIYWALKYSLSIPVTVLEGTGLGGTLSRSSVLTKGSRGRIFVVYMLIFILNLVVGTSIQFAFGLGIPFVGHQTLVFTATRYSLAALSGFVTSSLVGPLLTIAFTLIYYDQRVRKEGFDLQLMMSSLEGGAPAAAAPAPIASTGT
jgi:hypothetical protein